jgi:spore coat protein H
MAGLRAHRTRSAAVVAGCAVLAGVVWLAAVGLSRMVPGTASATTGDTLFDLTRVWTVHLRFSADQWDAMQPSSGAAEDPGGGGGGFGPPPGFGPPGGPDGGPGAFIASAWLRRGDRDEDDALSRGEFARLAGEWFAEWDANGEGRLDADALSAGLRSIVMPDVGERGGPPGPGGPRGPTFVGEAGGRNGMAAVMGLHFTWVQADLEFEGRPFPKVAVRYKGNNTFMESQGTLKRSMKIDLNRLVPGRRLGGAATINLHNNVTDASWMNEPLSYRLFRDAGVPAPRTSYARVYLTVAGRHDHQYLGLYSIVENEDNDFARDRFGTKKGALFKPVTAAPFEDLGDEWSAYEQTYDPKTPLSAEETSRVIAFAKFVSHATDAEFDARVEEFLDFEQFARFMAATTWLSNMDSLLGMGQNYVVYLHPKTRQFQFIPWDLDHSFGQFMGGPEESARLDIVKPWNGEIRLLDRVFSIDRFRRLYLARMREFTGTVFVAARLRRQVDELAPVLRPAVKDESEEKLARFDRSVAGQDPGPARGGMRGGPGMGSGTIKSFVGAREPDVAAQLAGRRGAADSASGGPGGRRGPMGPPDGGPERMMALALLSAFDRNGDGGLTRAESEAGFARWFDLWDTEVSDSLTADTLRAGIERDVLPRGPRGGFPGPPQGSMTGPSRGR